MRKFILIVLVVSGYFLSPLWGQAENHDPKPQKDKQFSESKPQKTSESTETIRGKIVDEKGEPAIGANVSMSETFIGTTTDLNGDFQIDVPANTKSLKISFIGYATLEVVPKDGMSISLQPDMTQVNEVLVFAQQPSVQITAEKTTVYPASSPITSSGNAYSVLKNLPGVMINSDGSLFLNGQSGITILVDGKNSYLSGTDLVNYLMSFPASSLSKIELINHPSAKYEAAGNAGVIDLCTKKNKVYGYNMNVNTNYEQGKYGRSNNSFSFGYRHNKLNLSGMYGYYQGKDYVDLDISRNYAATESIPADFFDQDSYRQRSDQSHSFHFGADFYANQSTTIGMTFRGNFTNRVENGTLNALFYSRTSPKDSTAYSQSNNNETRKNFTSSFYVQHHIDSLGKEISASLNGLYYSINETQCHNDLLTRPSGSPSEAVSQALKDGTIKMGSGRVDLTCPVNKNLRFDGGVKSDFVKIDNTSIYENKKEEQWLFDPTLSSTFYYKENINAVYLSSRIQKGLWVAEAGFRMENTNIEGDSVQQSYNNFFPNVMLSRLFPNANALNFTYDRRIDRPNYRSLNPFVYIFDNNTYEQGNTELKPQFTHRFNLSYTIRKTKKVSLFYAHTNQVIMKSYVVQPGSTRVCVMPTNMASFYSYGIQGDVAQFFLTKWFQMGVHTELMQNDYQWSESGFTRENENVSFQISLQNHINLPWGWSGEVSGFYNSRMAYGQIDVLPIWQVSGGIQKNFLDGNATLSIFSNDWFHSIHTRINGNINQCDVTTNEFYDHTILGASFTYRFKKGADVTKTKDKRNIDSKRISL